MKIGKRHGRGRSPESSPARISGILTVHRDGYGFVAPVSGGEDIFVPARYLRENLNGDRVEVETISEGRGGKREGRIAKTLERAVKRVTGILSLRRGGGFVRPDDERLPPVFIPVASFAGARDGEAVVAEIVSYPADGHPPAARIVEVLGRPDDPEVEVLTIIRKYELPDRFSDKAMKAARSVPETPGEADITGRTDLRQLATVTIDGETARDFDDAVTIRREGNNYRLWVSIADVSHYVLPGSPLDREALLRGTSVYFPDRCIPMLPEELSNGICSLNPGVDRLTLTAEMLFDREGQMLSVSFYPSIIRSAARLTYTLVSRIIEHDDATAKAEYPHLVDHLRVMHELSLALIRMRRERGSIDFDLPEAEILLGAGGSPEAVVRAERNQAHKLIESFMLAANEAVASHLASLDTPLLYRIHELPDQERLAALADFLLPLGYDLPAGGAVKPAAIQALLAKAEGKPEERLINRMLLRSMKQARYAEQNFGHFGLAAPFYTHFTSPIRRYPDLVVHRILKWALQRSSEAGSRGRLKGTPFPGFPEALIELGEHTSRRERVAMEAERDLVELKKVQFMAGKVGEEFDGFVDGVSAFGFFVELVEFFVEGLVHISTLPPDQYRFLESEHTLVAERSGVSYRIGDPVRIVVAAANADRRQLEFVLAGSGAPGAQRVSEEYARVPVKGKKPEGWGRRPSPSTGTNGQKQGERRGGKRGRGRRGR